MSSAENRRASYAQKQTCRKLIHNPLITDAERDASAPMISWLSSQGADEMQASLSQRIQARQV